MPRNINDFPVELLRLVLQKVKWEARVSRDGSVFNTLATCRLWHQIGEGILWTDINLTNPQLIPFVASTSSAVSLTRTLSITISPVLAEDRNHVHNHVQIAEEGSASSVSSTSGDDPHAWRQSAYEATSAEICKSLQDMSHRVGAMQHLESFSIYVRNETQTIPIGFHLRGRELRVLFDALPASVRQFELDDDCYPPDVYHWVPPPEEDHLCPSFKKILPRLHNFRLRRGRFCEAMFAEDIICAEVPSFSETTEETKNTFLINTHGFMHQWGRSRHCSWNADMHYPGSTQANAKNGQACDLLVPYLRKVIARSALSNFQQYLLIDVQHSWPSVDANRRYDTICERILGTEEKLKKSAYFFAGITNYPWTLRYPELNGNTAEVMGTRAALVEFAEGQVWVDTVEGYRIPSTYINGNPRFRDAKLQPLRVRKGTKPRPYTHENCDLLGLEEHEGHKLLLVGVEDGLDYIGAITRQLTRQEQLRKEANERGEEIEENQEDSEGNDEAHYEPQEYLSDEDVSFSEEDDDGSNNDDDGQAANPANYL